MRNSSKITQGAILLAIYALLLLISTYVPIISILALFFLPVPFVIYYMKQDIKAYAVFSIASMVITLIMTGPLSTITALSYIFAGLGIGSALKQKLGNMQAFLRGTVGFLIGLLLMFVLSTYLLDTSFIEDLNTVTSDIVKQIQSISATAGVPIQEEQLNVIRDSLKLITSLVPFIFIIVSSLLSIITLQASVHVLRRMNEPVERIGKLYDLQLPRSILWVYLLVLLVSFFIGTGESESFLFIVVLNAMFLLQIMFVLQGLSFIAFYLHKKGRSSLFIYSLVVVCFLIPLLFPLIEILGIIDLGFQLRKKWTV